MAKIPRLITRMHFMVTIERSALVGFSCAQMYELVNDVARYPEFMAGCSGAEILAQDEHTLTARLSLSKAGFQHSFVTRNRLEPPHEMHMQLVEGPFKHFDGYWRFKALGDLGCKVSFQLCFEFDSRLLAVAASKLFEKVASQQVDSLCLRAQQLYGQ
ncbi:type II toxin-antitoxin system RatA family toxin [Simiduia curdlanivorans]|uniref:Type II toxin-antitoxin system RatA family toxin n=1 Tax=Simiduia curdlanivorans TaxID=1492769 RepID=A0ABV8V5U5_9GAMM|nr:type II toxin-antitoxin system RatA family toxin [Simiduia curdlanivorans]MDN3640914.1 type II toxin-antitoxin system RatA family toxin [Simiduia curdlanivorans]